jgi:hypothetical protein
VQEIRAAGYHFLSAKRLVTSSCYFQCIRVGDRGPVVVIHARGLPGIFVQFD